MAVRRSNTEPHPLDYYSRPHLARAKSAMDGFVRRSYQSSLPTSTHQYRFSASLTAASPLAINRDKEDPFSLAGFFPASPEREGEGWEWLRQEQSSISLVCSDYLLSEGDMDGSLPATPGPVMFARAAEHVIEETIKGEDKMGVLSILNTIFWTKDARPSEDKLYSPYAEDEAVDHESLYLALSRLRHDSESQCAPSSNPGDLFLEQEAPVGSRWWPVQWALRVVSSIV